MIPVDAAHASVHYLPDRRFRAWIRPSVRITVTVLILLPEAQTEDRWKSDTPTAKAIAKKGRLRLSAECSLYTPRIRGVHEPLQMPRSNRAAFPPRLSAEDCDSRPDTHYVK
jgi:hypothetical protein